MTAIALLFSVFKSKPSPFCVLDEVDAALDEANNERFNLIVDEFKKMSQFIVVTHSKRTMSIADVLFGVTMQTQGVSKKISVKFGDEEDVEHKGGTDEGRRYRERGDGADAPLKQPGRHGPADERRERDEREGDGHQRTPASVDERLTHLVCPSSAGVI